MKSLAALVPRGQNPSDFKLRAGVSLKHENLLALVADMPDFLISVHEDRVRVQQVGGSHEEVPRLIDPSNPPRIPAHFENDAEMVALFQALRTHLPEPRSAVKTGKGYPVLRYILPGGLSASTVLRIHEAGGKAAVFASLGKLCLHLNK